MQFSTLNHGFSPIWIEFWEQYFEYGTRYFILCRSGSSQNPNMDLIPDLDPIPKDPIPKDPILKDPVPKDPVSDLDSVPDPVPDPAFFYLG